MKSKRSAARTRICKGAAALVALILTAASTDNEDATAFRQQIQSAMDRMMHGMHASPSGDVDQDFVTMMEPHHQGAIEMAVAELRYGRNEQLRRIAQEIIIDQQQEIAAMRMATGRPLPPSTPAPSNIPPTGTDPHPAYHGVSPR